MSFIGIIAESRKYEIIKTILSKKMNKKQIKVIDINKNSIKNLQNVKFETIIINSNLNKLKNEKDKIERICKNAKYLILNSDINMEIDILKNEKLNIITYGLNQKATVTVSSIKEQNILVVLQRNILNIEGKEVEVEEKEIKLNEKSKMKIYDILLIYIIFTIYNQKIMDKI